MSRLDREDLLHPQNPLSPLNINGPLHSDNENGVELGITNVPNWLQSFLALIAVSIGFALTVWAYYPIPELSLTDLQGIPIWMPLLAILGWTLLMVLGCGVIWLVEMLIMSLCIGIGSGIVRAIRGLILLINRIQRRLQHKT